MRVGMAQMPRPYAVLREQLVILLVLPPPPQQLTGVARIVYLYPVCLFVYHSETNARVRPFT